MRINSCIKFVLVMTIFRPNYVQSDDQYIIVEKQGVIHKFVSFDKETDHFVKNVFQCQRGFQRFYCYNFYCNVIFLSRKNKQHC